MQMIDAAHVEAHRSAAGAERLTRRVKPSEHMLSITPTKTPGLPSLGSDALDYPCLWRWQRKFDHYSGSIYPSVGSMNSITEKIARAKFQRGHCAIRHCDSRHGRRICREQFLYCYGAYSNRWRAAVMGLDFK
jgi:hypothetical protein